MNLDELLKRRDEIDQKIENLMNLPAEPDYQDPDFPLVVWFQKTFSLSKMYTYAAVKAGSMWYVTGPQNMRTLYTWERLMEFIQKDERRPVEIWTPTGYEALE